MKYYCKGLPNWQYNPDYDMEVRVEEWPDWEGPLANEDIEPMGNWDWTNLSRNFYSER